VLTAWYLMWAVFTKKGWWALAYLSVSIFFSLLSLAFYHKRQQSVQPRDENV
jgi:putative exporter of polyketide antibiotics